MSQPDRNSQKENKSRGNEPNFNWRGVILIAIAFALIALAIFFGFISIPIAVMSRVIPQYL